jgi:hypothetical protein
MKTTKSLLTITLLILLKFNSLTGQIFEGKIIYRSTIENAMPDKLSKDLFNQMFNEPGDSIAILYLRNEQYKFVQIDLKTQKPKTTLQYDPIKRRIYSGSGTSDSETFYYDLNDSLIEKPNVIQNDNDTIYVLGKKCKSITISDDPMSKNIIYYSDDYKVDTKSFASNTYGFSQYIYLTGALPLKIIMTGNGAPQKVVYTAKEIVKVKLDDKIFKAPK